MQIKSYVLILLALVFSYKFCLAIDEATSNTVNSNSKSSLQKISATSSEGRPLMVVSIMIKNEEHVIKATLQPYADAGIQDYLIFDTGSTDKTIEKTEEFFKENNIKNGIIKQEPFIDFATSRNRALDLTEELFPDAHFIVMLDAEWYMHNVDKMLEFCEKHKNDSCPSYLVRLIMNDVLDFYAPRLIKPFTNSRFYGVVHETLNNTTKNQTPAEAFFEVRTSKRGEEASKKRWFRDRDLLLKEAQKNPKDPRTLFYLGQTYDCLGDLENARLWYEKRVQTPGWYEENFVVLHRLGQVYENLGNWDRALYYYMKAYENRPCRVESLIKIAQHYLKTNEMSSCYLFAKKAVDTPYPTDDILFVEKDLYDFSRYDTLGIAAWYVGDYSSGKEAILKALQAHPEMQHLKLNLEYYNSVAC